MRSLRRTLLVGTTLGTTAVFVAAGVLLYLLVRTSLTAQLDRALLDEARLLASTVEQEQERLEIEFGDLDLGDFQGPTPAAYLQLTSAEGETVYRSWPPGNDDLGTRPAPSDAPACRTAPLPDGRPGRILTMTFLPRREHAGQEDEDDGSSAATGPRAGLILLALARSTASLDRTLARLRFLLVLVGAAAIGVSAALMTWLIRRSLRPLESLAAEIGQLKEDDLARRIAGGDCPSEISPVIDKLNGLLQRLEAAFERERAFSANVAHELRNPLAGLRLRIDVATAKARQPQEYLEAMDECLQIAGRMQQMVENLLSLARIESGRIELCSEQVHVEPRIREAWMPLEPLAHERRLRVAWSPQSELSLQTDAALLDMALRNVLENAAAYAEDGGHVRISTCSTADGVEIRVANSGSRLSQAEAEQALGPFWRGDAARPDPGLHCGLGLSLVHRIGTALGGTVTVKSEAGGDFEVTLVLPQA